MARSYSQNVFINCPFDADYRPLFESLVFVVHDCGFIARSAQEVVDTGEVRIDRIRRLIRESKYGIHDISRTELDRSTRLPRFNMPLELGLFMGAKEFVDTEQQQKVTLVLEHRPYAYQRYCSDIAGQDVSAHLRQHGRIITAVRDWLSTHSKRSMPGGELITERCQKFRRQLPSMCHDVGLHRERLTFTDYTAMVVKWLKAEQELISRAPGPPVS